MEPYKYHLIPRTKGFKVCLPVLKKYCDSICTFDICFEEDHSVISGANLLQGMKFNAAGLMKRIPMSEVPEDPDEAAQFLLDLYREKDKAQECFLKHKNFSKISDLKPIEFKPKLWILINELFWMFVSMTPIAVHLLNLLIQGYFYSFVVKLFVLNLVRKFEDNFPQKVIFNFSFFFSSRFHAEILKCVRYSQNFRLWSPINLLTLLLDVCRPNWSSL